MPAPEAKREARLEKLAVGALLRVHDTGQRWLADAAHPFFAQAAQEYAEKQKAKRRELAAVLVLVGDRMATSLRRTVIDLRKQARTMALVRLGDELKSKWLDMPASKLGASGAARIEADAAHATMAGDSLVSQWRSVVFTRVRQAERKGESIPAAFGKAERPFGLRLRRTSESEGSQAYVSEHIGAARDAVRRGDLPKDLQREWSALVDSCELCRPHHGERVGIDEEFDGGDEPGDVHMRCRCVDFIV